MVDKNYIILAHSKPKQLLRLIHRLDDGYSRFYIHIDVHSDLSPFTEISELPSVHIIKNRMPGTWGDISIVEATLLCMNQIISDDRNAYTILLSGQCYPLVSCSSINSYLEHASQYDHIMLDTAANNWHNYSNRIYHYKINLSRAKEDFILLPPVLQTSLFCNLKNLKRVLKLSFQRKNSTILRDYFRTIFPKKFLVDQHYGGSQWFGLSYGTLQKVDNYIKSNPGFINSFRYCLLPDEMFFHTIIGNLADKDQTIQIRKSLTYVNWERHQGKYPVVFSVSDFSDLQQRSHENYLFARKFDADFDVSVLNMLDKQL